MSMDESGSQAQSISVSAASASGDHLTGAATTTTTTTEEALGASMDLEASEAYTTGSTHMQKQHQLDTSHILQASLASLSSNTTADVASQQVLSAVPLTNATGVEGSEDARMASPSTSAIVSPSFIISDAASTSAQTTFALSQLQPENSQPQIPTPGPILMLNSSNAESVCTSVPSMASIPSNADPSSQQQQQQMVHGSLLAQQAAFVAAMNSTTQLNMPTAAQNNQYVLEKHAAILPLQTSPVSHTNHSRSTSVVDGMVAMFPGDSSNAVTPRSGVMMVPTMAGSSTQPMAAQIQLQLQLHQQHQQQLEQQFAASNASAFASANHSGAPSPYATLSDPSAAEAMVSAHCRQLSSTTPGAFQQQQQLILTDTPTSLSTAPPTLVPGTPTTFGQLQFPPAQLSNSAGAPYSHHQHPHFGHSRHLSLDNANFRLAAGEASAALYTLPPHATVQEHHAGISQGLQSRAALIALQQQAQQIQQQQLFHQQLQAQAHALAQQKAAAASSRTVPITPQTPMTNGSTAGAFQASSLADSLIQHQQLNGHHRGGLMHHSSASVDLGALSSAFNVAQLNYTLSGQNSPVGVQSAMAPTVGVPQMQHLPHLFGIGVHPQDLTKQEPLTGNDAEMARSDDDGCDGDGSSSEATDKEANGAVKGSSNSGAVKCSVGRTKRPEAPYKRFRNSFIFFANDRRQQWKREHPEVTKIQNRGFIQCMGKVWNNMSAEEKAPYMKMAEDDKLRYEADVKRYGPLPTSTPSTSVSSSGPGTAANTTPTALSNAQATASVTAGYLRGGETSSVSLQVSIPSVVPIAPAPAMNVATIPTIVPTGNTIGINVGPTPVINTAHINAAAAIAQPTPISPAYIGHSHPLPVEAPGVNPALLSQQSYQMMLQQAFGQDLSPQAVEFDPSCFVGPEAQSADASTVCFNPFSGTSTAITEGGIQQHQQSQMQQLSTAPYARRGSMVAARLSDPPNTNDTSNDGGTDTSGSSSSSKTTTANGPPITTLVGTKRKSSSDGQPMTSLPVSIKRFRNSFIYFVDARRQELLFGNSGTPTNVELNNRAFLKEMSAKWRMMSEEDKAPYLRMADVDKERFTREMREYELEHPEEFSKQSRHRRRRSSTTSNGISAGSAGLDPALAEPGKLQSAAAAATMPFMPPLSTGAYGLNISLTGMASSGSASPNGLLPFAQNVAGNINSVLALSSAPIEAMAQELSRAVATSVNTPISTAVSTPLTTPLLSPNVVSLPDKTEMLQLSIGHVPSLPSVPEEIVVGTNAATSTTVASSVGMAGSTPGYLATAPKVATLPTVLEGADEDVNMI